MKAKIDIEEMKNAGLFVGHVKSSNHPRMKPYISGEKNYISIIDLEKTKEKFLEVFSLLSEMKKEGKVILLVGTKMQAKEIVKEIASELKMPYVSERWLGGTITNFPIIKKRVDYYKSLEEKKNKGELEKYTKKERLEIDREIERLRIKFEGIKEMENIPDAVFILDIKKDISAVKEARKKGILSVGISDTNNDPSLLDHFIPANNDSVDSIKYILNKLKEAIL